jgi:hypothetical protein
VAVFDDAGEAADGEEITNEFPRIEGELKQHGCTQRTPEMCRIQADFKHFRSSGTKEFQECRNVSSIMRAKVLSIMPANAGPVTSD